MSNKVEATFGPYPQHHVERGEVTPSTDRPGCGSECEDATECDACGMPVCPLHSPEFSLSECVEGGWHHQDDCEDGCLSCSLAARDDYLADYAEAMRDSGDWW